MSETTIDLHKENVQGLIIRGYTHPCSCHLLFRFPGNADPAAFVKALLPYLQDAGAWENKPDMMLNIGFTYSGVKVVANFPASELSAFDIHFIAGPADDGVQDSLGDKNSVAPPAQWLFGGTPGTSVDAVVHTYAMSDEHLKTIIDIVTKAAKAANIEELIPLNKGTERLTQYPLLRDFIHFGYKDGISEPALAWPETFPGKATDQSDLNNFLIGYPDSSVTPRPNDPAATGAMAFAKDGCYNAFRVIYQDVEAFENYLEENAAAVMTALGKNKEDAKEWLAAKLCGRWRNGSPLMLSEDKPEAATDAANDFGYESDPKFSKCPYAAHIRVSNPREEQVDLAFTQHLRLIRRGVPYGSPKGTTGYKNEQGLVGLFLCGSLLNQFAVIAGWMNNNEFKKKVPKYGFGTQDALLGNRNATKNKFTIALNDKDVLTLSKLPPFVLTRGTAYCLLPSLSTLKAIAGEK